MKRSVDSPTATAFRLKPEATQFRNMKLNPSACLAMAGAVIVLAAPFLIAQAARPDAKELAAVERVRART
ncbi:MAG TPA: hypothetical protein VMT14_23640, partial [Burkholderiaceae bacterium]|nr:hypothetical protein [Burkholderiaceae bacterium]